MRARPRLIAFTDLSRSTRENALQRYAVLAARAIPGGVLLVLRDYTLSARERWHFARALAELSAETGQLFGVADRADIARALGAQALHLPEQGLAVSDARRAVSPSIFISRACHDASSALTGEADAVLLSPIFEPRKGRAALGLARLEQVCAARTAASPLVYALGGANAERAGDCLTAGAAGVAVIGAALEPDPSPLLEALEIRR